MGCLSVLTTFYLQMTHLRIERIFAQIHFARKPPRHSTKKQTNTNDTIVITNII